ncbi:hypothetical protein QBC33DRAFT_30333 [Phialemonium atrogriseum]|uniref:Uncharacterized protein n=1 Tax=Phialemonium atrogriseum TaxID=1093897 RepID=A0AAJ0C9U8_9PEZI|nr:uncharacterized protein QBC33DRAFT_30333 [Phialemonium atrogriseum]KAK1772805.1 hypothetical protein QBC33DRAFT_30333 [Phialemonium atrogriseum]
MGRIRRLLRDVVGDTTNPNKPQSTDAGSASGDRPDDPYRGSAKPLTGIHSPNRPSGQPSTNQYTAPGYAGLSRDGLPPGRPLEGNYGDGVGPSPASYPEAYPGRGIGGAGDNKSMPQPDGYEYRTGGRHAQPYDGVHHQAQHQCPRQTRSEEYGRDSNGQPQYYATGPPPGTVYYGSHEEHTPRRGEVAPADASGRSRDRSSSRDRRSRRKHRRKSRDRRPGVISQLRDAISGSNQQR